MKRNRLSQPGYLGVDIGGTKCAVVLGDAALNVVDRVSFATEVARGPDRIIKALLESADSLLQKHGLTSNGPGGIKAIGISCGGPLDSARGLILSPPNLPGWDGVPITRYFSEHFGAVTALQNDANAGALAEWMLGAGRGVRNLVFLTFGTGLGAGLILDGRLYAGTNDLAGELGHWRLADDGPQAFGKCGSFEGFCSGAGIAQLAQQRARDALAQGRAVAFAEDVRSLERVTTKDVAVAAKNGDPLALDIFAESGRKLGAGLSLLIDLLNPQRVVIGSVFARCQDLIYPHALQVMEAEALAPALRVCEVVPAALGEAIGDVASLCVAQYAAHTMQGEGVTTAFQENEFEAMT
ncbi:ROK family protein [Microbulbifer sp. Q7]|uniref:ROK family protein n=1 Tax=Microbulbifer sp. Q7 TaxID=1785091 RepID=UPI00082F1E29|nr:ROK family protein [Microbulbifer sp. Q7]